MIFRLYHETKGGHVHCRLFAGRRDGALGKCGDFTMRVEEFDEFRERMPSIEFRPEAHLEVTSKKPYAQYTSNFVEPTETPSAFKGRHR